MKSYFLDAAGIMKKETGFWGYVLESLRYSTIKCFMYGGVKVTQTLALSDYAINISKGNYGFVSKRS